MAVTVQKILEMMQRIAPPELACRWDNVGLLVDAGCPVTGVLTALDITPEVVAEAAAKGCQLIVSHHPVIFSPMKRISSGDIPALLLLNGISAICMHTNLDAATDGVNDLLSDILGMTDRMPFAEGCGRIGSCEPTTAAALAALCAEKLNTRVKFVDTERPIVRLAEVSGSGGSELQEAIDLGADCLVTGEASHHHALLAQEKDIGLVVAGHWGTEHLIAEVLCRRLGEALPDCTVQVAEADQDPFAYL